MSVLLPEKQHARNHERKNFNPGEKERLFQLIDERIHILGCKETDNITISRKKGAWEEVLKEFNSNPNHQKRTVTQLMKCWDNEKSKRKKVVNRVSGNYSDDSDSETNDIEDGLKPHTNFCALVEAGYKVLPNGEVIFSKYSETDSNKDDNSSPPAKRLRSAVRKKQTPEVEETNKRKDDLEIELLQIRIEEAKIRRDIALIEQEKAIIERDLVRDRLRPHNSCS